MKSFVIKYKIEILFVFVIIAIFSLPRIFSLISKIGFTSQETGYTGDTIGGITAPIIGLFSALLVYIAFKEQVKANIKLQAFNEAQDLKNEWNYINTILENIKLHYESLTLEINEGIEIKKLTGREAVNNLFSDIYKYDHYVKTIPSNILHFTYSAILAYKQINYFLKKAQSSTLSPFDKQYFRNCAVLYKVSNLSKKDKIESVTTFIQQNNDGVERIKEHIDQLIDEINEVNRLFDEV